MCMIIILLGGLGLLLGGPFGLLIGVLVGGFMGMRK